MIGNYNFVETLITPESANQIMAGRIMIYKNGSFVFPRRCFIHFRLSKIIGGSSTIFSHPSKLREYAVAHVLLMQKGCWNDY